MFPSPVTAPRRSGRCNGNHEAHRGGWSAPGSRPRPPGGTMPIAPHDDRAPQGAPAPRRAGAASSGHPGTETTSPRRHRDLVAWIALGLVVATVLTVVARVSVAPPRHLAATKPAHQTASRRETPSTTILATYKQARDHVRTEPGPTQSAPQPTNPVEVAAPVTTVTTSTTVPSPRPSVPKSRARRARRRRHRSSANSAIPPISRPRSRSPLRTASPRCAPPGSGDSRSR